MKKLALVIGVIVVAFTFASCGKSNTPSSITSDCIEMLQKGDYEAYVNTFDMPDKDKAQLKELFDQKGKSTIEEQKGIVSYEILEETINEAGDEAVVKAVITYGNGETDETKFHFKKVNDEWKQVLNK